MEQAEPWPRPFPSHLCKVGCASLMWAFLAVRMGPLCERQAWLWVVEVGCRRIWVSLLSDCWLVHCGPQSEHLSIVNLQSLSSCTYYQTQGHRLSSLEHDI